jgi:hypothetical protein
MHTKKHTMGGKRRRSTKKRGGSTTIDYGGADKYALATYGNGEQQWNNVFKQVPGQSNVGFPAESNALRTLDGKHIAGGSRRRRTMKRKSKKGGYWASVLQQAIVPFTLLGLQQKMTSRK